VAVERSFFEVTAQVIPLLLLVGLVEYRGSVAPEEDPRRARAEERTLVLMRLAMMIALVLAEVAALTALAGRPTRVERGYVIGGLSVGGLGVVVRFLDVEFERLVAVTGRRTRLAVILVVTIVLLGLVVIPAVVAAL
jgi:hypothetical protein